MSKRATPTRSKKKPAIAPTSDTPPVDIPRPSLHREDRLPIYAVSDISTYETELAA